MSNHQMAVLDDVAKLSKVAESREKRVVSKTITTVGLAILLTSLSLLYFASKSHSRQKVSEASNSNPNTYTLQENLNALERMQQEALAKSQHTPNITISTDGLKIGNPNVVRAAPIELDSELVTRMNAPTTFINVDEPISNEGRKNPELAANATPMIAGNNLNSAFLNTKNSIKSVNAVALPHPDYTLSAGEFIPAILETAVNSDLPGLIRAVTSRDVYALTGNRILIPKGSRLIGQYSSGNVADTQNRLLVSWTRVQLPTGVVVTLNSPSTDSLGRSGQAADSIDRHSLERFSTSFLFSILGATTSILGVNQAEEFNSASAYRMEVANGFQQTARERLQESKRIQSTLNIDQGTEIKVFVARDLNFFNVTRR